MDRKKILFIGGIIAIIITIIAVIIYFAQNKINKTSGESSITLAQSIDEKVFAPQYISSQQAVYYYNQGLLSRYSFPDNKITRLYPDAISYLQKVKINPDGTKALILIKESDGFVYENIDFNTKNITPLSKNIVDVDWLSKDKIIYTYSDLDTNQNSLNIADYKGENIQKLTDLDFSNPMVSLSPDKTKIMLYPEPEGYGENFMDLYNLTTSKLNRLSTKGIVGAIWSPDSQKIVTNIYKNESEFTTAIMNIETQEMQKFDFSTAINKITWLDNENIVAAETISNKSDQFQLVSAKNGKSKEMRLNKSSDFFLDVQYIIAENSQAILFTNNDFLYKLEVKK